MMTFDPIILPLLLALPFAGGLLAWQAERLSPNAPRWIALVTMTAFLVITALLWQQGNYNGLSVPTGTQPQWQLEFQAPWIPYFGISFHLALDGLSLIMLLLTGFLGVVAVACSWKEIDKHVGFFYLNLTWNLGGVAGVFLAIDMFLYFVFWEVMLVPMYFLIALWGHKGANGRSRISAATKFFIFTQASGLLLLLAIIGLVLVHLQSTGVLTFDYTALLGTKMAPLVEMVLMLGFFIAFAVKLPVVPVHSWLPDAHAQAPTAGSVDLAGVLLKTAGYGLLRFGVPLFPQASLEFAPIAMWLGIIGVAYGAVLACAQTDIKRLVAYTSVSHMGFVLIGIYAGNLVALQGTVVLMLAHGLSAGALFIICGEIYERLHTRDLREMGGLWTRLRYLPPITLAFAAASMGLPGMGNFVGEILVLLGAFKVNATVAVVAAGGLILAAIYGLLMIQKAFYGPTQSDTRLPDLNGRELTTLMVLLALLIGLGVYPQPVMDTSLASMQLLNALYTPTPVAMPLNAGL